VIRPFLAAALLALALPPFAAPGEENAALLGVVTVPAEDGVRVVAVVPSSPADEVGLEPGDVLRELAGAALTKPRDVNTALAKANPGDALAIRVQRDGEQHDLGSAELIARREFASPWVRPRPGGTTGFEAPEWHAYAWAQVAEGEEPPSRANTAGKVVVLHAFQSW
jgi:membrane-associated protease RseP (regulator of RpoE activity)